MNFKIIWYFTEEKAVHVGGWEKKEVNFHEMKQMMSYIRIFTTFSIICRLLLSQRSQFLRQRNRAMTY